MDIFKIKLKHLRTVTDKKTDYARLLSEVYGFRKFWFFRKLLFKLKVTKLLILMRQVENIEPTKVLPYKDCTIKKPKNVDNISFQAMMEAQSLLNKEDIDTIDFIKGLIVVVCYQENIKTKSYNSNSNKFIRFQSKVDDMPLLHAFGLFNIVLKELNESQEFWQKRFLEVEVTDNDYNQANGQNLMDQFNVINTIKNISKDFNLPYEKAWQISYTLSQTNNLAKATENYIQDQMRIIKENKMKRQRAK